MPDYTEKIEQLDLPMVILRGVTAFPSVTINFELSEDENMAAVRAANAGNGFVLLVTSKGADSRVNPNDIYKVGTAAKIKQSINDGSGSMRVIAEGFSRASVVDTCRTGGYYEARVICKTLTLEDDGGIKGEAYVREAREAFENILKYFPSLSDDIIISARSIRNPGLLADFIASNVMIRTEDKQEILECFEPLRRVEKLIILLGREEQLLECELGIHKKVRARIGDGQRERYLREQMRAIEEELGEVAEEDEYYDKIIAAHLPKEVEEKLLKENDHMAKAQFGSAEATVIRNYLDICLELPWNKETKDRIDISAAKKILDEDHYGLEKVKERILEFLAVKKLNPELKSQIICLVGPPGTGKTSVAKSIASAMKRKYVRVSLGGVRDEADIRGHRKTYVAAMPGRIMTALSTAKVKNPLMLLDEIDKLGNDSRGDPSSALLEALDPEQNKYFRDHFVELPFDLSDCLFVCTANSLSGIPRPLIDRMEIIELSGYTRREKLHIAKDHLLKKQMKRHGLNARTLKIDDDALYEIIDYYTREAGVRNLEREIAAVCRKAAVEIVQEKAKKVSVTKDNIEKYLGVRKFISEKLADADEVGVVNGLAYTESGGDLLKIEVAVMEGTGKLELTGSLGDVIKESAHAALSYIRSARRELGIPADFYKNCDIHIHFPEGAVPKDGPSAGVTITTALVSALTGRPVRRDIAMTGEVTLRGKVLAIGGLKEKTMAAYTAGIKKVIIPYDNLPNLEDIDPEAKKNLVFVPAKHVSEVLAEALLDAPKDLIANPVAPIVAERPNFMDNDPKETPKGDFYGA